MSSLLLHETPSSLPHGGAILPMKEDGYAKVRMQIKVPSKLRAGPMVAEFEASPKSVKWNSNLCAVATARASHINGFHFISHGRESMHYACTNLYSLLHISLPMMTAAKVLLMAAAPIDIDLAANQVCMGMFRKGTKTIFAAMRSKCGAMNLKHYSIHVFVGTEPSFSVIEGVNAWSILLGNTGPCFFVCFSCLWMCGIMCLGPVGTELGSCLMHFVRCIMFIQPISKAPKPLMGIGQYTSSGSLVWRLPSMGMIGLLFHMAIVCFSAAGASNKVWEDLHAPALAWEGCAEP
eukprot:Gb_20635 [translate_table: standard]